MNFVAWLKEGEDLRAARLQYRLLMARFDGDYRRAMQDGEPADKIATITSIQQKATDSYREKVYVVQSRRLIRRARDRMIPIPALDDHAAWIPPTHGVERYLSPTAFDAMRQAVRRESWALEMFLRFAPIIISIGSLVIAILALLKK